MTTKEQVKAWQERAMRCLAGGVSSQFRAADPLVFSHGRGSRIWDVDGNEYLDYTLSQGPLIHGHCHPEILEAVSVALGRGQVWNGLFPDEIELAEQLVQSIPCADAIRLGCTGSEAVQAALRLARGATGRMKFIKFEGHYHGWLDSVAVSVNPPLDQAGPPEGPNPVAWTAGMGPGTSDGVVVMPWNNLDAVERAVARHQGQVAAIITEPCMCNSGCIEPAPGYLEGLRSICDRHGIVLIFDEVITGFRLALGGAQEYYRVMPDLAVFGKAVASGFPVAVLAGKAAIMQHLAQGRVIHAGTLNAHVGGVAAALASLRLLKGDGQVYHQLQQRGRRLIGLLRKAASDAGHAALVTGPGPMFHMGFLNPHPASESGACSVRNYRDVASRYDMAKYARFVRGMADRGVRLIGRGIWYLSTVHSDADVEQAAEAARQTLHEISHK